MKALSCNFNMVTIWLCSIFLGLSCSNDSDLLVDAVLSDSIENEDIAVFKKKSVVDDFFVIEPNERVVLDVLANDDFALGNKVRIMNTSTPEYGSVKILNNKIAYTPQEPDTGETVEEGTPQEVTESTENTEEEDEKTDSFTYTTSAVRSDGTTSIEEGLVEIVIETSTEDEEESEDDDDSVENDDTDDSEGESEEENDAEEEDEEEEDSDTTADENQDEDESDPSEDENENEEEDDADTTEDESPEEEEEEEEEDNTDTTEDEDDSDTTEDEEENAPPKAVATAAPISGELPLEVQFKGDDSFDDNKIDSYLWNFKDGSTSTNSNPTHTFKKAGEFRVSLTVKDKEGLTHSKTVTINVAKVENKAPKAVVTAAPTTGKAPLRVQFDGSNSSDDNAISSYHWDFNDGESSTQPNPSHTFNNPGNYQVRLTVEDSEGLVHSKTINVSVDEEEEQVNSSAKLLFSSGFEGVSLSNEKYDYRYIEGTDSDTGFSWPPKILGSTGTEQEPSGIHVINDGGNSKIHNRLEKVTGHNGKQTTALFQGIDGTAGVTQTPYQINNIKENPDELYITYWMKIDNKSLSGAHKWRALWEYKTKDYGSGGGFRMIAFIYTDNNGRAYWNFQGDRNPSNALWEKSNYNIPVPREEWFKVEYYFKWSKGSDGRAFMKVNGQLVGEHNGPTTANSKNLDFIILTQVYGDTSPMHQWVDDIEIWDGLPY